MGKQTEKDKRMMECIAKLNKIMFQPPYKEFGFITMLYNLDGEHFGMINNIEDNRIIITMLRNMADMVEKQN